MKHNPINRENFELDKFAYSRHNAFVPAGFTKEDLLDPAYWSHVKGSIRTFDEVRVVADDASFVARLFVQESGPTQVVMRLIEWTEFDEAESAPAVPQRYGIAQKGRKGWCLIDNETQEILKSNLGPESSAMRELEQHLRALAA